MRNQARPGGVLTVALAFACGLPAFASGPFTVRRADCGANLDGSPTVATVAVAPFDETMLRSTDTSSYFYGVYDASGARLLVSVQAFGPSGPIRIGFDDGNPASAPVSASQSAVLALPASVEADGLHVVTILVSPRDADGRLLGRGLTVAVDPGFLWPLALTGPVVDLGDGSYRATAAATTPGEGSVRVDVEGVVLASQPEVEATSLDASSLRDLAVLRLRDLTSGDRFGAGPFGPARMHAVAALALLAEDEPSQDDNALKNQLDQALRDLAVLPDPDGRVADLANDLLDVAALIALWHLEEAEAACGSCDGPGQPEKMCEAADAFDAAEAVPRTAPIGWSAAMDAYANAIHRALQAEQSCL